MLLMFIAMGLSAGDPQPAPQQDQEKPKLICRDGTQELGSHMRIPRRCKTEEQWKIEDDSKSGLPVSARVVGPVPDQPVHRPQ